MNKSTLVLVLEHIELFKNKEKEIWLSKTNPTIKMVSYDKTFWEFCEIHSEDVIKELTDIKDKLKIRFDEYFDLDEFENNYNTTGEYE